MNIDLRTDRGKWALETAQRLIAARLGGAMYQETISEELGEELVVDEETIEKLLYLVDALALVGETLAAAGTDTFVDRSALDELSAEEIDEVNRGLALIRRSPQTVLANLDAKLMEELGHS